MNKYIVMVIAVIVAILTGWLVLSIAQDLREQPVDEQALSRSSMELGEEVPTPSFAEIQVTIVESVIDQNSNLTAEVVAN